MSTATIDAPTDQMPPADPPPDPPRRGPGRPKGSTSRPKADPPPKGPGRPKKSDQIAAQLTQTFAMVGVAVTPFNQADGLAIIEGSERLAVALVHVGEQNPKVMKALETVLQTTAWGEVLVAVAMIGVPIMANHGVVPPQLAGMMGATPPPPDFSAQDFGGSAAA